MEKQQIEILDLREAGEDGGGLMGWYAKGHHHPADFVRAVQEYSGIDSYSDYKCAREADVIQTHWRTVPIRTEPGQFVFHEAKAGKPGAFAVTVFDFANRWATIGFEDEKRVRNEGREAGQREAMNFAFRWVLAVKGPQTAEELLTAWNRERRGRGPQNVAVLDFMKFRDEAIGNNEWNLGAASDRAILKMLGVEGE